MIASVHEENMRPILSVQGISKNFSPPLSPYDLLRGRFMNKESIKALDNVTFELAQGEILAVLGPNGAGKTTLLKILATLIIPDQGSFIFDGIKSIPENEIKIKPLIGFSSSIEKGFYHRLTGEQNLEFFCSLRGLDLKKTGIKDISGLLGIDFEKKRFDSFSTGMQQKLSLCRALLHDPKFLVLDEPTKSLDYATSLRLKKYLRDNLVRDKRKTLIFTTHQMEEALDFADKLLIINKGMVLGSGTFEELRRQVGKPQATLAEIFMELTQYRGTQK
jgi:ABC-2 type transport system ATP-binding protein